MENRTISRRQMLVGTVALTGVAVPPDASAAPPATDDAAHAGAAHVWSDPGADSAVVATRLRAAETEFPSSVAAVFVAAYAVPQDGGRALYVRVRGPGEGRFRSADGAWWEYVPEPGDAVDPLAFGVRTDGGPYTREMQEVVDFAAGRPIRLPAGRVHTGPLTGGKTRAVRLFGSGAESELRLGSAAGVGTETLLDFDEITLRGPLTLHDAGRPAMDHTGSNAVYLCKAGTVWDVDDKVDFVTDRAVVVQVAQEYDSDSYARMTGNVSVRRATPPLLGSTDEASEEDQVNVFVFDKVRTIAIDWLRAEGIMARSLISCTAGRTGPGQPVPSCSISGLSVDLFQCNGRDVEAKEVKCVFVQGYQTHLERLAFTDVFGRYVDVLGNEADAREQLHPSVIRHLRGGYTDERKAVAAGRANDEAGAVYCRYPGALTVEDVQLDFSNLEGLAISRVYSGVAVRHGSRHIAIRHATIVAPRAHAIQVDISDAVSGDHETVLDIEDVTIRSATNAVRKPIRVQVDSAAKKFERISIRNVDCDYRAGGTYIEFSLGSGFVRTQSFGARYMLVDGCIERRSGTRDAVDMQVFPEWLDAPTMSVPVRVTPGDAVAAGTLGISAALALPRGYRCHALVLEIDPGAAGEHTVATPVALGEILPRVTVIRGDNGAGGRLRFGASGTWQASVSVTLRDNEIVFDGCTHDGDAGGYTTSLLVLTGSGICRTLNCTFRNAEHAIDSRGPDYAIEGGSVDDIRFGNSAASAVVRVDAQRPVRGSIARVAGGRNSRLYNHASPAVLLCSEPLPAVAAPPISATTLAV